MSSLAQIPNSLPEVQTQDVATKSSNYRIKGVSIGVVAAAAVAAVIAFHAIGFVAQMIFTPIVCGIAIGIAGHIIVKGPKESIECAKQLAGSMANTAKDLARKTPAALEKMGEFGVRSAKDALQFVGRKVCPPSDVPYTVSQVAKGLAIEGGVQARNAYRAAKPVVIKGVKKGAELTKEGFQKMQTAIKNATK